MKYSILVLFFLCLFVAGGFAGEIKDIELKDGSVIYGEIVSYSNGSYTIKSSSLGNIKIDDSKILSIRIRSAGRGNEKQQGKKGGIANDQVQALQNVMATDKEILKMILSLQNDPDFQKVLSDPAVMNAVTSGDISALTSNPKFMKLLNKSTVKDITGKVGK